MAPRVPLWGLSLSSSRGVIHHIKHWVNRHKKTSFFLCGLLASSTLVLLNLQQQLSYRLDTFNTQAEAIKNHVEDNVRVSEGVSLLMQTYLHSNPELKQHEFADFVDIITGHYPFFSVSTYAPIIDHSKRESFEQWMAAKQYPARAIYAVNQANISTSDVKPRYLPVQYIYPLNKVTRRWVGLDYLDIRSAPLQKAVEKAITTGRVTYTAPIMNRFDTIVRMNIYIPAYHGGEVPAFEARQEKLSGLVIISIRPDLMMADNNLPANYTLRLQALDGGTVGGESRWQSLATRDGPIVQTLVKRAEFSLIDKKAVFTVSEDIALSSLRYREFFFSVISGWAIAAVLCFGYWARKKAQQATKPTPAKNLPLAIGHEIKATINTAYENLCQINEYEEDIDNNSKRAISTARHQCQYAMRTINTLLQIEKIQAGQLTIFKKPVDIVELIKTSIDGNRSLALQKNTDFYLSSEQSCLLVNIDRSRIQQVIETLLINMAKAAVEKNTVAITITCSENYLLVDMRSHNLATDKPLDTDGEANNAYPVGFSELQFNLCKALLELHGGKLGFKNRSDRSNSIWFQLPLPIETNNAV